MLDSLVEFGKNFVADYGLIGLFIFSFTESFIQPIPPDTILLFTEKYGFNPFGAFFVALIGSILGGAFGYFLGLKLGHPAALKIFGEKKVNKVEKFLKKWEFLGVFLAAFTPFPFKIITWTAGIFEMPFWQFMIASTIGRGLRFALVISGIHFLFFV